MHMQDSLRAISKWGKFLGYMYIVMGALSALGGVIAFVVGAIPGIICIFLGLYILRSAKQADELERGYDERALSDLMENYAKFLRLTGIMMVVTIVMYVAIFLFWGSLLIASLSSYY